MASASSPQYSWQPSINPCGGTVALPVKNVRRGDICILWHGCFCHCNIFRMCSRTMFHVSSKPTKRCPRCSRTIINAVLSGPAIVSGVKRQKYTLVEFGRFIVTTWRSGNVVEHGVNNVLWQVTYKVRGYAFATVNLVLHKCYHQVAVGSHACKK